MARRPCGRLLLAACLTLAAAAGLTPAYAEMTPFRSGEAAVLRALPVAGATTDLALVNLSSAPSRCKLTLTGDTGEALSAPISMTLQARESRPFLGVFDDLRPAGAAEATATISCDRAFSAFAVLSDAKLGRFDVVAPAAGSEAERAAVAALPAPSIACSPRAECFDAPGLVHVPKPPSSWADAVGRVAFPAPAGVAKRLVASLDVKVGPWYAPEPSGKHLIYWFVISKNIDMPGLLYFRGPGKDEAFGRHGVGLTHPEKIKMIKPFAAQPGHTYRVVNDYDMTTRKITISVIDLATGETEVTLTGRTNVDSYTIKAARRFLVDMGFYPGKVATEVPSYGWEYSNVHVEAFLK